MGGEGDKYAGGTAGQYCGQGLSVTNVYCPQGCPAGGAVSADQTVSAVGEGDVPGTVTYNDEGPVTVSESVCYESVDVIKVIEDNAAAKVGNPAGYMPKAEGMVNPLPGDESYKVRHGAGY